MTWERAYRHKTIDGAEGDGDHIFLSPPQPFFLRNDNSTPIVGPRLHP